MQYKKKESTFKIIVKNIVNSECVVNAKEV